MSAVAGRTIKVYAKSTNAAAVSGDEIDGLNDAAYNELAELLETTDFKGASASGWKTRLAGLQDGTINLSGDYESADAPQTLLRTSKRSGADCYITIHFNPTASAGSKGFQVPCIIESYEVKSATGSKVEISISAVFNGAVTDV